MSESVTGFNANRIGFTQIGSTALIGAYRQVSQQVWKEDSVQHGRDQFEFVESARDDWSIYLFDVTRKVALQIDLYKQLILVTEDTQKQRPIYGVATAGAKPTGWLVNHVEHGNDQMVQGAFKQTDASHWTEQSPDGKQQYVFNEISRDDWSVYLNDPSRDMNIQLDLFRNEISYGLGEPAHNDLYTIVNSSATLSGWLVNQVWFGARGPKPLGSYRQTGPQFWVEDSAADGQSVFEMRETGRDDWSVYLHDEARNVKLQLDLFRRKVVYQDANTSARDLYSIMSVDRLPRAGMQSAMSSNWVEVGDSTGKKTGIFRQTGEGAWSEDSEGGARDIYRFHEVGRDTWSIYLLDDTRGVSLQLDLYRGKVLFTDATQTNAELASVLNARSRLTGWMVNHILTSSPDGKTALGAFRQVGWTSWVEDSIANGPARFIFDEKGRDDWTVTLFDASRQATVQIDLNSKTLHYSDANVNIPTLATITSSARDAELWQVRQRITSRAALGEEFTVSAGAKPVSRPVYRSSVSLPAHTTHVDVWASEETTVEINETSYTIDPTKSVRVRPSQIQRLMIVVPALELGCPSILLRSNLMKPDEKHVLLPDVEAHKKITALPDGALYAARTTLGLTTSLAQEDIGQVQRSLQNIAKTVQYSYNDTNHGVHRDRAVLPSNMEHPHFMMDFSAGGSLYTPLTKDQVLAHIAGAQVFGAGAAQNIFDDIGDTFKQAGQVIVHTATAVVSDVVDTTEHVVNDVVSTVDHVGEHLVHGDLLSAAQDFVQGGENLGTDLFKGVQGVAGDLVNGAKQIAVITLKLAGKVVQFVLDHTGVVGKALGWLIEKVGAAIGSVIGWLLDKVGWEDTIRIHDVIGDLMNQSMDTFVTTVTRLKTMSDSFFGDLATEAGSGINHALQSLTVDQYGEQPPPPENHSSAIEKVEWLIGKLSSYALDPVPIGAQLEGSLPGGSGPPPLTTVVQNLRGVLGDDGGKVKAAFGDSMRYINRMLDTSGQSAQDLLAALLEFLKGGVLAAIDMASKLVDGAIDLITQIVLQLKNALNETLDVPFVSSFYQGLTGRTMTTVSVAALLVAIPTSIIGGPSLFAQASAAHSHTQGLGVAVDPVALGFAYGAAKCVTGTIATVSGLAKFREQGDDEGDAPEDHDNDIEMQAPGAPGADAAGSSPMKLTTKLDFILGGVSAVMDLFMQMGMVPTTLPVSSSGFLEAPVPALQHDVFRAPDYWSAVTWIYQWVGYCGTLAGGIATLIVNIKTTGSTAEETARLKEIRDSRVGLTGDIVAGLTAVYGAVHMGLMSTLTYHDQKKLEILGGLPADASNDGKTVAQALEDHATKNYGHVPSEGVSGMSDDRAKAWLADLRSYQTMAQAQGAMSRKGFGNVMDTFPEVAQICFVRAIAESFGGVPMVVGSLMIYLGSAGEGITYCVRTHNREFF